MNTPNHPPRIEVFTNYPEYQELDSFVECNAIGEAKNIYLSLKEHKAALAEKDSLIDDFSSYITELERNGHKTRNVQLEKKVTELETKLALAVEALNEIASWCPTPNDPDACKIAECKIARDALAALKSPAKSEDSCSLNNEQTPTTDSADVAGPWRKK